MRRISYIFLIMGLMASTFAYAQKQAKPSLNKVEALVNKGKENPLSAEDLSEAKQIIDLATEYEKTKDKTRTWYLRGFVYKFIYESENEMAEVTKKEAIETSSESFSKALELGKETDTYVLFSNQEIEQFWGKLLNDGVNAYQGDNLDDAIKFFQYTTLVKPNDTTGYLYAASAASEAKQYQTAIDNYRKLVKINPKADTYVTIIALQKDFLKDVDAAVATIEEAKSVVGDDNNDINKVEIDILIVNDRVDEALAKIDKAIDVEPDNPRLYLRRGLLYDQLVTNELAKDEVNKGKVEDYGKKAEDAYKKTVELDPDNLTAYFNYSVIISNKANVYFKEINMMTPQEFSKNGKELEKKGLELLAQAAPLMEKARELDPDDRDVLYALQSFYSRLEYADKLKEVNAKLKELGYDD